MKINILTVFPEMLSPLFSSILGRAAERGILDFHIVNIRDFAEGKHCKTDDYTFGGGQGMVMLPAPAFAALASVGAEHTRNIFLSPRGALLDRTLAEDLSQEEEITIFCGHYEGIDQRIMDAWRMEEISIGDYVLTGGETAALVLIDVVARLIPGVLASEASALDESVYSGLLEYPQYTKPRVFEGIAVPDVLLSGNHAAIDRWRFEQSLKLTKERRPDLFSAFVRAVEEGKKDLPKDWRKVLETYLK